MIGKSIPRVDAWAKVTGQAKYPGDVVKSGMLFLKILFAGHPHARIVQMETHRARELSGVVTVLTADDVPVNEYGSVFNDQPVLCEDVIRFEGDQVAAVVAETEAAASFACQLIDIEYEILPVVEDVRAAMQPGCVLVHRDHPYNVLQHMPIRKGNIEEGFDQAQVIVENTYYVPMQEHAFLQPEAGLAYMDGDTVVIESAGQWLYHDQRQIAHALGIDVDRVRMINRAIGGAFGGREDISVQIVLALAAMKTGRPVKIVLSREESIRGHCKRHQMYIKSRFGATKDGKLTAAEVEVVADAGAYAYTSTLVLGQVALTCTGVYEIPHANVDVYMVYTNNVPGGAFRGFGSPQGIFSAEQQMDKLAEKLGIDAVTIREINLLSVESTLTVGTKLPSDLHLDKILHTCARKAGWQQTSAGWKPPHIQQPLDHSRRRGIGIAIGFKNVGFSYGWPDHSSIKLELHGGAVIEDALIYYSGAECGQGTQTAIQQIAADALNLPIEKINMRTADTKLTPDAGSASASRLTLMAGNAVLGAAEEALQRWQDEERPAIAAYTYHAPPTKNYHPQTGHSVPNFAYGTIAQAIEVEVDIETGRVDCLKVFSAIDAGKAVNPKAIEGQVEGGVAQGLGYALMENFIVNEGHIHTSTLSTYLIPTSVDIPQKVETVILEIPEPIGPRGVRGIGENAMLGIAPAIATAIKQATGVWFTSLPLTPQKLFSGLQHIQ